MFVHALFYWAIILVALVHSHTVPGLDSLHIQSELSKRDNLVDSIYNTLPDADIDFINTHLSIWRITMHRNVINVNTESDMVDH